MVNKSDVLALLASEKDKQVAAASAAVAAEFDSLSAGVSALADVVSTDPDLAALQAQVIDLQSKLDTATQALAADDAKVSDAVTKEQALQAKIDAALASLK